MKIPCDLITDKSHPLSATVDMCIECASWKALKSCTGDATIGWYIRINLRILNRQITNMCIANRLPMLSQPTVIDWHSTNTRITVKWHLANISTESWPTPTTDIVTNMLTDSWQRCWLTPPIYNLEDTWSISFSEKNCFVWTTQHITYISHSFLSIEIFTWKSNNGKAIALKI